MSDDSLIINIHRDLTKDLQWVDDVDLLNKSEIDFLFHCCAQKSTMFILTYNAKSKLQNIEYRHIKDIRLLSKFPAEDLLNDG